MTSRGRDARSTTLGGALGGAAAIVVVAGVAGRVLGRGRPRVARRRPRRGHRARGPRLGLWVASPPRDRRACSASMAIRPGGGGDPAARSSAARFRGDARGVCARARVVGLRETTRSERSRGGGARASVSSRTGAKIRLRVRSPRRRRRPRAPIGPKLAQNRSVGILICGRRIMDMPRVSKARAARSRGESRRESPSPSPAPKSKLSLRRRHPRRRTREKPRRSALRTRPRRLVPHRSRERRTARGSARDGAAAPRGPSPRRGPDARARRPRGGRGRAETVESHCGDEDGSSSASRRGRTPSGDPTRS